MKKLLMLSIVFTFFASCMHMGSHKEMACGCDKGKPCKMESKDGKPAECDDCKKAK